MILAVVVTALASCDVLDTILGYLPWGECSHSGGTATCTAQAICEKCGEPYGDKAPHDSIDVLAVPASCMEAGHTSGRKCSVCGEILHGLIELSALGHSFYQNGVCEKICLSCGFVEGEHQWKDATCTAPKTCEICKKTEGDATGHTGGTATCTEKATCTVCHEQYGEILDHTEVDMADVPATCGADGSTGGKKCSICETVTVQPTVIPASGVHTEVPIAPVAATCGEPGWTAGVKCSTCELVLTAPTEIPATGDHKIKWVTTPPTATEHGRTTVSCSGCSTKDVEYEWVDAITDEGSYILEWSDLIGIAGTEKNGTYADGDVAVKNNVFAIHTGKKITVDQNKNYSWSDGYAAQGRINFGSKTQFKSAGYITNGIEFTITQKATVKIWWMNATKDTTIRQVGIYDLTGNIVAQSSAEGVKDAKELYEVELEPGTYIIGNVGDQNYISKIGVYVCTAHDWADATCTAPKTCKKCGITSGNALGHDMADATCTAPSTCKREGCTHTVGNALPHTYENGYCKGCGGLDPDHVFQKTIAELASLPIGTKVEFTGFVVELDGGYNPNAGTMSLTLSDGNGNTIYLYNVGYNATLCQEIKVTGTISRYNGKIQVSNGEAYLLSSGNHTYAPATCLDPKICTVCTARKGNPNGHSYGANGICEGCGLDRSYTALKTFMSDYARDNSWSDGVKNSTMNVDSNITVTVVGGANSGKYYSNGASWRMYQNEDPTITVCASEGKTIAYVKITYISDNEGYLTLNGTKVDSQARVDVNAGSITFGVSGSSTKGQARITAIEVVYQ